MEELIKRWMEEQLKAMLNVVMENNSVCSERWERIQTDIFSNKYVSREQFEMLENEVKQLKLERAQRESEVEDWKSERSLLMAKIEKIEKAYAGLERKLSEVNVIEHSVTYIKDEEEVPLEAHVSSTLNQEVPMVSESNNDSGEHCSKRLEESMPVLYPGVTHENEMKIEGNCHGHDTDRASSSTEHYCKCGKVFGRMSALRSHIEESENVGTQRMQWDQHLGTSTVIDKDKLTGTPSKSVKRSFTAQSDVDISSTISDSKLIKATKRPSKVKSGKENGKFVKKRKLTDGNVKCDICAKYYSHKSMLTRHVKEVHIKENGFDCKACSAKFWRKSLLERHIAAVHDPKKSNGFSCSKCRKFYAGESTFNKHMLICKKVSKFNK